MIEVNWDNDEQTIIMCQVSTNWTIQDMHNMLLSANALTDSVAHNVYVIVNFSAARTVPSNIMSNLRSFSLKIHPRVKMAIDVTDSAVVETFTQMFTKVMNAKIEIQFARTVEQAYELIQQDIANSA